MKPVTNDSMNDVTRSALTDIYGLVADRWNSDIVGVAAELGLADHIQGDPKTAEQIAARMGLHAPSVYRLMRALATLGIFAEQGDGSFAHTAMSEALRSDVPHSLRGLVRLNFRPWTRKAWQELEVTIRTGIASFEQAQGIQLFDYLTEHPDELQIFADAMRGHIVQAGSALAHTYDFTGLSTLADIGGSQGLILSIVLNKYPSLHGILFDLPPIIEGAPAFLKGSGVEERIELRAGDFFQSVPSGADAYLLSQILHDWSDADCLRILRNIHTAAIPQAKLLLVETIVEKPNEPQFAKILDIWMLAHLRGKERTRPEWQNLLAAGGFRLSRTFPTATFACIIEAIRQ